MGAMLQRMLMPGVMGADHDSTFSTEKKTQLKAQFRLGDGLAQAFYAGAGVS